MNYPAIHPAYRKCLLPLIMALAVFFVSQGTELPSFGTLENPQLCASQKVKGADGACAKTPKKFSQTKSTKSSHAVALAGDRLRVKGPVVLASNCPRPHLSFVSSVVSVVSARAPPAV